MAKQEGIAITHAHFQTKSQWMLFKCICVGFFGAGICAHRDSMLMSLLYDESLQFPSEFSS
jgi:hypothetical protein